MTRLSVTKGKYLVFGSAAINFSSKDTRFVSKICINIYESFNNANASGCASASAFSSSLNCWSIIDIVEDVIIYLLVYHEADNINIDSGIRLAEHIKLQAIKLQ